MLFIGVLIFGLKKCNSVSFIRTKKIVVKTQKKMPFFGDGEILLVDNNFEIKVYPKAVRIIS